jgi:hypothetical protein
MRTLVLLGTAAALVGCGGGGARVAPVRGGRIAIPGQVSGTLTRSDQRLGDNSYYQAWTFFGTAGQNVQIDVTSSDFDAYAILKGPDGNEIGQDDDGGEGTNARIQLFLPTTGTYRVLVNAFRQGQVGRYVLRLGAGPSGGAAPVVSNLPAARPGTMGQIVRGQVVQGRLTTSDARLQDNTYFQAWTYYGQAGETITLDVMSTDFDAYAVIQDPNGNALARDDDAGGNLNARITFTLPYTGAFRFIANTLRQGATGAYTLSVR